MHSRTPALLFIVIFSIRCVPAADSEIALSGLNVQAQPLYQWRLPPQLREISALAMTEDRHLFAVDDETAVVHQIDYVNGQLVKSFGLGKPAERADFEGLASVGNTFYLMTSAAVLYIAPEGGDGDHVSFRKRDTGLGDECEFEGLAYEPEGSRLLLLCKAVRRKAATETLSIFTWDLSSGEIDPQRTIELPVGDIAARLQTSDLHPSGIAVHPADGSLLIVAARQRALFRLRANGSFVDATQLPGKNRHPQAEGIEFGPDGLLFVADEGGKGRARLTVYTDRQE